MAQTAVASKIIKMYEPELIVRKAVIEDTYSIREITKKSFLQYSEYVGGPEKVPALKEKYEDIIKDISTKEVFLALIDGVPAGSVRIEIFEDKTAYLSRFGVLPEYQHIGIGRALLKTVDLRMMELGISKLLLHTAAKATPIICCYYKNGFYIDSTTTDRGYIRALLCKEYYSEREKAI